jgi:formylmethanofuran dehydrogenase subunit E
MNKHFEEDLKKAGDFHGHICAGMLIGVRLARAGLEYLGIDDPADNRDFIVYCEIERCLTDAVQSVAGVSPGKRRLKIRDYGKMAASFVDMRTGKGIRLACFGDVNAPDGADLVEFFSRFADRDLFKAEPIEVVIPSEDLPGRPVRSVVCSACGEKVMDARDISVGGRLVCRPCAEGAYYTKTDPAQRK